MRLTPVARLCAIAPSLWHGDGISRRVGLRLRDNSRSAAGPLYRHSRGFWPIGFIAAGLLSLVILPHWGWRGVFLLQAIPALFVFVIRRYVPESPRWLAFRRSYPRRANPILPLANGAKNTFPLVELWSSDLARRTLMIWTVWFFALLG